MKEEREVKPIKKKIKTILVTILIVILISTNIFLILKIKKDNETFSKVYEEINDSKFNLLEQEIFNKFLGTMDIVYTYKYGSKLMVEINHLSADDTSPASATVHLTLLQHIEDGKIYGEFDSFTIIEKFEKGEIIYSEYKSPSFATTNYKFYYSQTYSK